MNKGSFLYKFCNFIATVFYIGYLPKCPGTFASLFSFVLFFFLPVLPICSSVLIAAVLLLIGLFVSNHVAITCDLHDPSKIVIDEVLGSWISVLILPHNFFLYFFAFILFRFFDISKILFVNHVEKLRGGWGIMLDDVLAGIFTLGIMWLIRFFVGI